LRPSSSTRRYQQAALAGQLSLFSAVDPLAQTDGDQAPAIPAPFRNPCASAPAIVPESADLKPRRRRRQSGKRKPPATASLPPAAKLLVSRKMAAEMLTISIRKLDYMIADGRLLTRKIDNRVLIPAEEIHKFARSDDPRRRAG
jgi:hypothetical protein